MTKRDSINLPAMFSQQLQWPTFGGPYMFHSTLRDRSKAKGQPVSFFFGLRKNEISLQIWGDFLGIHREILGP